MSAVVEHVVDELLDVEARVERREEWRRGYDAGLRAGAQRVLESHALEAIAFELTVLHMTAESLGKQADHWRRLFLEAVDVIKNPRPRS